VSDCPRDAVTGEYVGLCGEVEGPRPLNFCCFPVPTVEIPTEGFRSIGFIRESLNI
jgi:hypothetical protein